MFLTNFYRTTNNEQNSPQGLKNKQQEAHGPQLAHLSDTATADMQMLSNIFSILSLQLMKGSSFKQFFEEKYMGTTVNGV